MIGGAFKGETRWLVHVPTMIRAMQRAPVTAHQPHEEEGDPLEGSFAGKARSRAPTITQRTWPGCSPKRVLP
jgi:hypothetical protein